MHEANDRRAEEEQLFQTQDHEGLQTAWTLLEKTFQIFFVTELWIYRNVSDLLPRDERWRRSEKRNVWAAVGFSLKNTKAFIQKGLTFVFILLFLLLTHFQRTFYPTSSVFSRSTGRCPSGRLDDDTDRRFKQLGYYSLVKCSMHFTH